MSKKSDWTDPPELEEAEVETSYAAPELADFTTAADVELLRTVARANETGKIALYHERKQDPEGTGAIKALRDLADRIEASL